MGLDITFFKAKRVAYQNYLSEKEEWNKEWRETCEKYPRDSKELDEALDVLYNKEPYCDHTEVAYFRKVNFLLPFFDYEDNCSDIEVKKGRLNILIETCKEVLKDHSLAEELLPTQSGFFFGDTDYDESYFEDVRDVIDKLGNVTIEDDEALFINCWW